MRFIGSIALGLLTHGAMLLTEVGLVAYSVHLADGWHDVLAGVSTAYALPFKPSAGPSLFGQDTGRPRQTVMPRASANSLNDLDPHTVLSRRPRKCKAPAA